MGPRVDVITQTQRRRRWSAIEKKQMIEETDQPGHSGSYVARSMVYPLLSYFTERGLWNRVG